MTGNKTTMNYIEELNPGDTFDYQSNKYILTTDFKKNNSKLAINLASGFFRWFAASDIIDACQVYFIDAENNILPIKQDKKSNETHTNIS